MGAQIKRGGAGFSPQKGEFIVQLNSLDLPVSCIEAIERMARPLSEKEQRELIQAIFPR